ncbi:ribosome biogenesis protein NSA1 [Strigomonas culicis]|nr:ribosome biogenesis protein NSA1 [Strigomonas culicis]EPY32644.1 ribosome biogenesis protein NSA1 [Strigomonas culicis]|eukprot:EPY29122.1 ribosome biogenesis protein NSA1 [Strigomonas culicis]
MCVTGDETGLIKIWDISKSSGAVLKYSFGEQKRSRGIMGMCWINSETTSLAYSTQDGFLSLLDTKSNILITKKKVDRVAALPNSMAFVKGKLVLVEKNGGINFTDETLQNIQTVQGNAPVDACHIHRKYSMIAMGGQENDLCVYDMNAENVAEPVFRAKNVRDHVLDVPYPIFITGTCIINPFVFCTSTAYHQVRFYDRRASERPVQEYETSREIERKTTTMLQWNSNKFLIGEASGDVHLYDTRRGFTSRAKLRGGVGSVRCMSKHPAGHQILAVTGLDRKVRIYHVPTGKLLQSIYVKQKANCVLLDKQLPFRDDVASFSGVVNTKQPEKANTLGDDFWDDMDPVVDTLDEEEKNPEPEPKRKKRE